jgi:hypothetical protein
LIKRTIHQEAITVVSICAPNISTTKFIKPVLLDIKVLIEPNTIIVGDLNTLLSPIQGSFRQKLIKKTVELNDTTDQMDLTDVCRIFYPTTAEHTSFLVAHRTMSKTDHILGHKASLKNYKRLKDFFAFYQIIME